MFSEGVRRLVNSIDEKDLKKKKAIKKQPKKKKANKKRPKKKKGIKKTY